MSEHFFDPVGDPNLHPQKYILPSSTLSHAIDEICESYLGITVLELMRRVGDRIAEFVPTITEKGGKIILLCGHGNNGGDGFAAAKLLAEQGYHVTVAATDRKPSSKSPAYVCLAEYGRLLEAKKGSIEGVADFIDAAETDTVIEAMNSADLIIDAVFGTGYLPTRPLPEVWSDLITAANKSNAKRLAIDVPTGLDSDGGVTAETVFRADHTLTMQYAKTGFFLGDGEKYCGKITVADLDIPEEALVRAVLRGIMSSEDDDPLDYRRCSLPSNNLLAATVREHMNDIHKGNCGRVLFICGKDDGNTIMCGAPRLAISGALSTGAGLCELLSDRGVINSVSAALAEPIYSVLESDENSGFPSIAKAVKKADVVLFGCGIGTDRRAVKLFTALIAAFGDRCRVVLDADALNIAAAAMTDTGGDPDYTIIRNFMLRESDNIIKILTPHPLELARLLATTVKAVQVDRIGAAQAAADGYHAVVTLKGYHTITAAPDSEPVINISGGPGLAKGGSGDVLAGITAALLAQNCTNYIEEDKEAEEYEYDDDYVSREVIPKEIPIPPVPMIDIAAAAVYLHGLAGDALTAEYSDHGVLPSELPRAAAKIIRKLHETGITDWIKEGEKLQSQNPTF